MTKEPPQEKVYEITQYFQANFKGQDEAPSSWKIVNSVFLRKPDAEPKKAIRSYRARAERGQWNDEHIVAMWTFQEIAVDSVCGNDQAETCFSIRWKF